LRMEYVRLMLQDIDIISLDYDGKVKTLQAISGEILKLKVEFARISGRYAELRAELQVLKEVKSALQSVIKAQDFM
jgi:hypothetical protein